MPRLYHRKNLPPSLRRLSKRQGKAPRIEARYPCPQREATSPPAIREALIEQTQSFANVTQRPTDLSIPGGVALVLDESVAKGQPEAFITRQEFAIVRSDGSVHLLLPPIWGQKVLDKGWATIHPLARYLAGALPPQTLILYAPRDSKELKTALNVLEAAYCFAHGKVEGHPLPDTAW